MRKSLLQSSDRTSAEQLKQHPHFWHRQVVALPPVTTGQQSGEVAAVFVLAVNVKPVAVG
ncbi:MAG: hypothetical protein WA947_08245 [Phormidesmis sp.]